MLRMLPDVLFTVAGAMSFAAGSLLVSHLGFVRYNETTLESGSEMCKATTNNPYNLGSKQNIEQIYGPNKLLWLLPVFTSSGDGYVYPRREVEQV